MLSAQLEAEVTGGRTIELRWEDQENHEQIVVHRRAANGPFAPVATFDAGQAFFLDQELTPGGGYAYQIELISGQASSHSDVVYATTFALGDANGDRLVNFDDLDACYVNRDSPGTWRDGDFDGDGWVGEIDSPIVQHAAHAPPPPLVNAQALFADVVELSWADVTGEQAYLIERSVDGLIDFEEIGNVSAGITEFRDAALEPQTRYFYRVKSVGASGADYSIYSSIAHAATLAELNATALEGRAVTLSWSTAAGARALLQVQRRTWGEDFTSIANLSSPQQRFTDLSVEPGTEYEYRIRSVIGGSAELLTESGTILTHRPGDADGNGEVNSIDQAIVAAGFSGQLSGWHNGDFTGDGNVNGQDLSILTRALDAPAPPDDVFATPVSFSEIALSWEDVKGAELFRIERSVDGNIDWETIAEIENSRTTLRDTALLEGSTFFYRIKAVGRDGPEYSGYSDAFSTTTPLAPPGDASAEPGANRGEIRLAWGDQSRRESGYVILRSEDGLDFTSIATTDTNATKFTDTNLVPGQLYHYRVVTVHGTEQSRDSSTISAAAAELSMPTHPRAIRLSGPLDTQVQVTWLDHADNEDGFILERSDNRGAFKQIATVGPNISKFIETLPDRNVTYLYRLRAFAGSAMSGWSNVAGVYRIGEFAVEISASAELHPSPRLVLSWVGDPDAQSYALYRKNKQQTSWSFIADLPADAVSYTDGSVGIGDYVEYRITKRTLKNGRVQAGEGYIFAGIEVPVVHDRGAIVLIVDKTQADALAPELARFRQDLIGDGWRVIRHDVSPTDTVAAVKSLIQAQYARDPGNVKQVMLFGRVPVPYSGNQALDGHIDHLGAWPADAYFGDMDGVWTDSTVNSTIAERSANRNIPGDGKFDQNLLDNGRQPELAVGRVDMQNLPAFGQSETELLRQYLNKNHAFRHQQFKVQRRAMVLDRFGGTGSGYGLPGWQNAASLVGGDNVESLDPLLLRTQDHLWAHGSGPGSYRDAGYVNSTTWYVWFDFKVVFNNFYGSYFGDWDSTDNVLRAALADAGYGLTATWGTRDWKYHHMALGETIGYSTHLSQQGGGVYGTSAVGVPLTLLGDPTLRLHTVAPPRDLALSRSAAGVKLNWKASNDTSIRGYQVYRASSVDGPFTPLALVRGTRFIDSAPPGVHVYMVRAIKLEGADAASYATGTYLNSSQGIFAVALSAGGEERQFSIAHDPAADALVISNGDGETLGSVPASELSSILFNGSDGDDVLNLSGELPNIIEFAGSAGRDLLNIREGRFEFTADARATSAALSVNIGSGGEVIFATTQHLAGLSLTDGTAKLLTGGHALVLDTLSINGSGTLDLSDGQMLVRHGSVEAIEAMIGRAYSGSSWSGAGLTSSAAEDAALGTTLGVGIAGKVQFSDFAGESNLTGNEIIVKYTYVGDADLNRTVNLDDFNLLLFGLSSAPQVGNTWLNGDFDHDGQVNLDDFNLLLEGMDASEKRPLL